MAKFRVLTDKLRFPEGPVALADGSVLVVEIAAKALTRVSPNGKVEVVAELGGGPNGAAIGPDGRCYVCNNGGFEWHSPGGVLLPSGTAKDYTTGSIQAVDLSNGAFETLYTACEGESLKGPNDLVFDAEGGMWFTDFGKHHHRQEDLGAIHYAKTDGSFISEQLFPVRHPNGIALSPDGATLYFAETWAGRLWHYPVVSPGQIKKPPGLLNGDAVLYRTQSFHMYDSMAVEANGNLCVATVGEGGIAVISPDGKLVEHVALPDPVVTNIAFGGPGNRKAYITLSSTGQLIEMDWPREGYPGNFIG